MRRPRRLALHLDFTLGLPAYLQIVQRIEQWAARGRLQPGEQLPTVRSLAAQLDLNFNTVARAYRLLHRARIVSAQRGRGTYVIGPATDSAVRRAHRPTLQALTDQFLRQARGQDFPEADIAAMIRKRLKAGRLPRGRFT